MANSATSELIIRQMKPDEIALALEWAAREGWNPGLDDARCFYAADPDGFLIALVNGEPVGCISAVSYSDSFGFLGLYIVLPEHRGKRYGIALWNAAIRKLGQRNIGLDGVIAQQENYKQSGFKLAHRNIRYQLQPEDRALAISALDKDQATEVRMKIKPLVSYHFSTIADYDLECFGFNRHGFLENWTNQPQAFSVGASDGDKMLGYGIIRPCLSGYKIGPLFADSEEVAQVMLHDLLKAVSPEGSIYLDIPEPNKSGLTLAEKCQMTPVFETARMYTANDPQLPLQRIYGITSFELG